MICSIPTTGKPGSNWLDRLRSSKGFPTGDNLDLDHFLRNPQPTASNSKPEPTRSTHIRVTPQAQASKEENGRKSDLFTAMTNVLSELFIIGGANGDDPDENLKSSRKNVPRKQRNPKYCVVSGEDKGSNGVRNDGDEPATASFNLDNDGGVDDEMEEKEAFLGFSKSDVVVIDTSWEVWKTEKWVFRKKDVWKVKEKRGKPRSFLGRKKRKGVISGCHDEDDGRKKAKKSGLEVGESMKGVDEGQNSHIDTREDSCKDTTDDFSQVRKQRIPFSKSPKKLKKNASSVILIKGIPLGQKNGSKLSRTCFKETEQQYQD